MAITTITKSTTTLSEGWTAYNNTITALLTQHDSAGAHESTGDVVLKALFDANTILYATTDDTPAALTVAASRIVGRASTGAIAALTVAQVLTILGLDSNLADLATAEVQQLENIGTTTISAAQWGYLGACGAGGGQLLAALTTSESTQLEAIGTTTISAAQWGYLGACTAGGGQLLAALTEAESTQIEAIGTTTVSAAQWGYLGACGAGGGQLLAALTTAESTQIEAIGTTTISATQWGYVGAMNQGVATTSDSTFATLEITAAAGATPSANKIYKDTLIKGWIQFNGTGTIAIQDSFNVSSIADDGAGTYTINWDTNFANNDYAVSVVCDIGPGKINVVNVAYSQIVTSNAAGASTDSSLICVIAIGDQ